MTLEEYLKKEKISVGEFSYKCKYTPVYLRLLIKKKNKASLRCRDAIIEASEGKITEI